VLLCILKLSISYSIKVPCVEYFSYSHSVFYIFSEGVVCSSIRVSRGLCQQQPDHSLVFMYSKTDYVAYAD